MVQVIFILVLFTVVEPSFNAFEYNYEWQKADQSWTSEPAGLGVDFAYRVRYVGQDVANHFPKNPWTMPTDTWTNTDIKNRSGNRSLYFY